MQMFVFPEGVRLAGRLCIRSRVANTIAEQVLRDVRARGRDIEGCIKQWFAFVKPNFQRYVEPQRNNAGLSPNVDLRKVAKRTADIIVPRGIENHVAIDMMVQHIKRILHEKSKKHQYELERLGKQVEDEPLSPNVLLLEQNRQIVGMNTIIQSPMTDPVDFIFYFDRLATILIER